MAFHVLGDPRVQHLEAERDFFLLGVGQDFLQPGDHVSQRILIGQPAAESGERDDAFHAVRDAGVDALPQPGHAFVVFLDVGESFRESMTAGDGAGEPVAFESRPVLGTHEFDRLDSHRRRPGGELLNAQRLGFAGEAPMNDGLLNPPAVSFVEFLRRLIRARRNSNCRSRRCHRKEHPAFHCMCRMIRRSLGPRKSDAHFRAGAGLLSAAGVAPGFASGFAPGADSAGLPTVPASGLSEKSGRRKIRFSL